MRKYINFVYDNGQGTVYVTKMTIQQKLLKVPNFILTSLELLQRNSHLQMCTK